MPFNNNSNSVYTGSLIPTINNISSPSFVSNQSSTQRNQNFGDGDLQTGSVARENNKTNTSKNNGKVGHVNNNCNENAELSISIVEGLKIHES